MVRMRLVVIPLRTNKTLIPILLILSIIMLDLSIRKVKTCRTGSRLQSSQPWRAGVRRGFAWMADSVVAGFWKPARQYTVGRFTAVSIEQTPSQTTRGELHSLSLGRLLWVGLAPKH